MARFTLTGQRAGKTVSITWEDGTLAGDADAVAMVEHIAQAWEGRLAGPAGGPYTRHDHLSSPYTARHFMQQVFTSRPTLTDGALPPLRKPPKGAIN